MYTVVIMNKALSKCLNGYKPLMEPLEIDGKIAFCNWEEQGQSIETALPELYNLLKFKDKWRALILVKPQNINTINPFDLKKNHEQQENAINEECIARITRLLSGDKENDECVCFTGDKQVAPLNIPRPTNIFMLSPRSLYDYKNKAALKEVYTERNDIVEYSDFSNTNNYSPITRFLLYDIVDQKHTGFDREMIGFVASAITLMANPIPANLVQAYKLYKIGIEISQDQYIEFCKDLNTKLKRNRDILKQINNKIVLKDNLEGKVTDQYKSVQIQAQTPIKLIFDEVNYKKLEIPKQMIGLSKDCPMLDELYWKAESNKTIEKINNTLGQKDKALEQAIMFAKKLIQRPIDYEINKYHQQELKRLMEKQYLKMFEIPVYNKFQKNKLLNKLYDNNKKVHIRLNERMSKRTTIISGVFLILVFSGAFVPFVLRLNQSYSFSMIPYFITIGAIGLFALSLVEILFFLKLKTTKEIDKYNHILINGINGITTNVKNFGVLLAKMVTYIKGKKIIEYQKNKDDLIYKTNLRYLHIKGLEKRMEDCQTWMAPYKIEKKTNESLLTDEIDIEIMPHENSVYLPDINDENKKMPFTTTGTEFYCPYSFIKSVSISREEIYE